MTKETLKKAHQEVQAKEIQLSKLKNMLWMEGDGFIDSDLVAKIEKAGMELEDAVREWRKAWTAYLIEKNITKKY